MWSLPDIKALNAAAAAKASTFEHQLKHPEEHVCDIFGCEEIATNGFPYYDIFSDDIKGVDWACDAHTERVLEDENTFDCEACGRRMVTNYTHEMYMSNGVCLACVAEDYFGDADNWIPAAKVKSVVMINDACPLWNEATGQLNICKCKHALAVSQPVPKGAKFWDNCEFDAMDGHQISGLPAVEIIENIKRAGHRKFLPVLDAAYQFAVSIGFYVKEGRTNKRNGSA